MLIQAFPTKFKVGKFLSMCAQYVSNWPRSEDKENTCHRQRAAGRTREAAPHTTFTNLDVQIRAPSQVEVRRANSHSNHRAAAGRGPQDSTSLCSFGLAMKPGVGGGLHAGSTEHGVGCPCRPMPRPHPPQSHRVERVLVP